MKIRRKKMKLRNIRHVAFMRANTREREQFIKHSWFGARIKHITDFDFIMPVNVYTNNKRRMKKKKTTATRPIRFVSRLFGPFFYSLLSVFFDFNFMLSSGVFCS